MKALILILICTLGMATACTKDKFTTEPQVKFKSISPSVVNQGDVLIYRSTYTDKEGDIDTVVVVRKYYSGSTVTRTDTLDKYLFSSLNIGTNPTQAELDISFSYNAQIGSYKILPGVSKDTSATLGIILVDKAKHRSNYSESDKIVLKKT